MEETLNSVIEEMASELAKEKKLKYAILIKKDAEIEQLNNRIKKLEKQLKGEEEDEIQENL